MKYVISLSLISLLVGLSQSLAASEQYEFFARRVIEGAIATNWDYEKSHLAKLCTKSKRSLMKFPTANKQMEEQWQKGREDGKTLKITQIIKGGESSGVGVQVDVKVQDENSKETATYRLWIKNEGNGSLCLNGFNFF